MFFVCFFFFLYFLSIISAFHQSARQVKNLFISLGVLVESKAAAGKPYWNTRHDVTGSDFYFLPPYYSLAVPYLKVPIDSQTTAA